MVLFDMRKVERIIIKCKQCGKEFYALKCNHRVFCSSECSRNNWSGSRNNSIINKCLVCGKEYYAWPSRLKENRDKCCSRKCADIRRKTTSYFTVNNPSKKPENRKKIRESRLGEKSHFWKGGITPLRVQIYHLPEYREWRKKVFERDNYTCKVCGHRGGDIEADHIKSFSLIKFENNIVTTKDAVQCKELWDINNGRTLCKKCHKNTNNYGWKSFYQTFGKHPATKIYAMGRYATL